MDIEKEKWVYFLTSPPGCGKSTFMQTVAPEHLRSIHYYDPDIEIAKLLQKPDIDGEIQATSRFLDEREKKMDSYTKNGESFVLEITDPGKQRSELAKKLKAEGYKVGVIAIGVASQEIADARIEKRIGKGGHDVNKDARKWYRDGCLRNTPMLLEIADEAHIYDNTKGKFLEIARKSKEDPNLVLLVDETRIGPHDSYMPTLIANIRQHGLPVVPANTKNQQMDHNLSEAVLHSLHEIGTRFSDFIHRHGQTINDGVRQESPKKNRSR